MAYQQDEKRKKRCDDAFISLSTRRCALSICFQYRLVLCPVMLRLRLRQDNITTANPHIVTRTRPSTRSASPAPRRFLHLTVARHANRVPCTRDAGVPFRRKCDVIDMSHRCNLTATRRRVGKKAIQQYGCSHLLPPRSRRHPDQIETHHLRQHITRHRADWAD